MNVGWSMGIANSRLPLPFRNAGVVIPNNRTNASHRIAELKKRFSRDSVLQRDSDIVCMSDGRANFVATADDNDRQYGKSVGDALRTNFHVDDLLRSVGNRDGCFTCAGG